MALNGIDLTVYQGEALGIIGRNGAGKSTFLKVLSRITAPTEGEIRLKAGWPVCWRWAPASTTR